MRVKAGPQRAQLVVGEDVPRGLLCGAPLFKLAAEQCRGWESNPHGP
jgi:hypothetical protein